MMRPRDSALRNRYRETVYGLQKANMPVSLESVSVKLGIRFQTIRTFMYRNPRLAKELGLATYEQRTGVEYLEAAEKISNRGEKLNGYTLAQELQRNYSTVYRVLRGAMSIRSLIYEATGVRIGKGEIPDCITSKKPSGSHI